MYIIHHRNLLDELCLCPVSYSIRDPTSINNLNGESERKSKSDIQYNSQNKKDKRTNNDTQKTKDWAT